MRLVLIMLLVSACSVEESSNASMVAPLIGDFNPNFKKLPKLNVTPEETEPEPGPFADANFDIRFELGAAQPGPIIHVTVARILAKFDNQWRGLPVPEEPVEIFFSENNIWMPIWEGANYQEALEEVEITLGEYATLEDNSGVYDMTIPGEYRDVHFEFFLRPDYPYPVIVSTLLGFERYENLLFPFKSGHLINEVDDLGYLRPYGNPYEND